MINDCRMVLRRIPRASKLVEDGHAFRAGIVFGVENSKDPSVSEVTTPQVPEEDVPGERLNQDNEPVTSENCVSLLSR